MKILQLTAENVKRLQVVSITPDGAVVQITGRNGQGKSSVLDSIAYALGGKDAICAVPVRTGQEKARIICKLDDLIVTRTFTKEGGSALTVTNADGARYPSPQAVLDKLVGKLTLDPLAFSRMPAKHQLETLKELVGIDFSILDRDRAQAYADRTAVNRNLSAVKAQATVAPFHADAPKDEVSVVKLMEKLQDAEAQNAAIRDMGLTLRREESHLSIAQQKLADLRAAVLEAEEVVRGFEASVTRMRTHIEGLPQVVDVKPIQQQIAGSQDANRKLRENQRRAELDDRVTQLEGQAKGLTARIDAIDEEKQASLAGAAFPIPDLSFDDTGVTYKRVPFAQASSAEQLRASVAIGLAMNPKLRVLCVRDGSLLDGEGLKMLAAIAEEHDAQVWIERVEDGGNVGIVIEDGRVMSAKPSEAEAAV